MRTQHYIGGEFRDSVEGGTRRVVDPAAQELVAEVAEGTALDVDRAVAEAERAFAGPWRELSAARRGQILWAAADLLEQRKEEIARLETLSCGKPLRESLGDVSDAAEVFRYYAGLTDKPHGYTFELRPTVDSKVVRVPIGVCAGIVPWNYPILMSSWKLAPALAMGNTFVLKPSEMTPFSALATAEALRDAGVPPGVVNVVLGAGDPVGSALAAHPRVRKIAFTGGTATGRKILTGVAANMKRVSLELGGKSPNVIFDDADLDVAIDYAVYGIYYNQGEVCSAGSRLLVQDSIHDEVVSEVARRARAIRLGHGLAEGTQMGPLITAAHREKVHGYVETGKAEGARLVTGGAHVGGDLAKGNFYAPTVLADCSPDMRVVQEEIFGPVLVVQRFRDEQEALALANGTEYGLVAGVFTRSVERAHRMAAGLEAGVVWVNYYHPSHTPAPWGGFKQSGIGRELGAYAVEEYTEAKSIHVHLRPQPSRFYA